MQLQFTASKVPVAFRHASEIHDKRLGSAAVTAIASASSDRSTASGVVDLILKAIQHQQQYALAFTAHMCQV